MLMGKKMYQEVRCDECGTLTTVFLGFADYESQFSENEIIEIALKSIGWTVKENGEHLCDHYDLHRSIV